MAMIRALWAHRGSILDNVKREFQTKYRNALLGAAWNAINRKYLGPNIYRHEDQQATF